MASDMCLTKIANNDVVEFPDNWFILNPESASAARSVYVVEVKHGSRYDAPHFLSFSVNNTITSAENDLILAVAASKWPRLRSILNEEVAPIFNKSGAIENLEEIASAPCVGVFKLPDDTGNPHEAFPCGARVIRSAKTKGFGDE